jgi:hypothetical protein
VIWITLGQKADWNQNRDPRPAKTSTHLPFASEYKKIHSMGLELESDLSSYPPVNILLYLFFAVHVAYKI